MKINVDLDEKLVKEALRLTKSKSKRELIDLALRELVSRRQRKKILELEGKVEWEGNTRSLGEI